MRLFAIALLIFAACAVHAAQPSRLVVEYVAVGITTTVTIPCDWAHVILLKGVPPAVVWGEGNAPRSPAEALWRRSGLRNNGWTKAVFYEAEE